jgi:multicomponent Na+:H+ antiporter subunit A
MAVLLVLHAALAGLVLARVLRPRTAGVAAIVLLTATAGMGLVWGVADTPRTETYSWVSSLGLGIDLRLDGFAVLMLLLVSGLGALVLWYSLWYFDLDDTYVRFVGLFVAFAGAMTGLVLSSSLFSMFVFWELTSICSFLLIGLNDRSASARASALRALLVTGSGGLALLGGSVLIGLQAGTTSFAELAASPPNGTVVTVALVLVLCGAFTKSAQFPFHFWLPGAMAAPTPVSAYLHSATMVKAGVVLMARLAPVFGSNDVWRWMVVIAGSITMVLGGVRALRQHDAKLLLAHSTVSQLGLLTVLVGIGEPALTYAGVAMLLAHAVFKASLFLAVGVVDHATGTRDIRVLSGVGRQYPVLAGAAALAALSMAGVIPTLGFATKEKALDALLHADGGAPVTVALVAVAVGSVFTVAYTTRLWFGLFGTKAAATTSHHHADSHDGQHDDHHHTPGWAIVAPGALLGVVSLLGGLFAAQVGKLLVSPATALDAEAAKKLVLWAGFNTALVLSVLAWVLGGVLARAVPFDVSTSTVRVSGERIYHALLDGLLTGSRRLTAVTQSGSLLVYLSAVLATLVAVLAVPWLVGGRLGDDDLRIADSPAQLAMVAMALVFTVGVVAIRRRFVAALLVGGIGYSLAGLFMLYQAPDLALTQVLVETLTIVIFLLVLRRLPDRFSAVPGYAPRAARIGIAAAVGIGVAAFALMVGTSRTGPSASEEYVPRSLPEAGGENVVNVILVDFRGVDTMGEITVLAVAAVGVANLVRAARRDRRRAVPDTNGPDTVDPDTGVSS